MGVVKLHEIRLLNRPSFGYKLFAAIDVVGDVIGIPFVFGFVLAGRVANDDGVERDEVFGQFQDGGDILAAILVGESAGPDSSETHSVGGQKDVLGGGGAVLHPEHAGLAVKCLLHVAAHHDGKGCVRGHACVGVGLGQLFQLCPVGDHHEVPRLLVHRGRRRHARTEQLLDLRRIHGLVEVTAHGGACRDVLQRSIFVTVCLLSICYVFRRKHHR